MWPWPFLPTFESWISSAVESPSAATAKTGWCDHASSAMMSYYKRLIPQNAAKSALGCPLDFITHCIQHFGAQLASSFCLSKYLWIINMTCSLDISSNYFSWNLSICQNQIMYVISSFSSWHCWRPCRSPYWKLSCHFFNSWVCWAPVTQCVQLTLMDFL